MHEERKRIIRMKKKIALILAAALTVTGLPASDSLVFAAEDPYYAEEEIPENAAGAEQNALPAYVEDDNRNPGIVSAEDMNRYIEDGTWDERTAFMDRIRTEQRSLTSQLIERASGDEDISSLGAAEAFTGIPHVMPSEGNVKTLFITVEFKDYHFGEGVTDTMAKEVFASDSEASSNNPQYPYESLTAYYQRASGGELNLSGELLSFKSEFNRSYYDESDNNTLLNYEISEWLKDKIIQDKAEGQTDTEALNEYMSKFDSDKDYQVDGAYLLYAGPDTGWGSQWWSYRYDPNIQIGDYKITNLVMNASTEDINTDELWENKPPKDASGATRTLIHETGHMLGLDDYYSASAGSSRMGASDMMNNNTGDHNAYSKILLGWKDKAEIKWVYGNNEESNTYTLNPYVGSNDALLITTESEREKGLYSQFILAEHYKNTGNDTIRNEDNTIADVEDGIRLFRIYGSLNDAGNNFIASNPEDSKIPFIHGFSPKKDANKRITPTEAADTASGDEDTEKATDPADSLNLYRAGNALTAEESWFYYNDSNNGIDADSVMKETGISIDNIRLNDDGTMSLSVNYDAEMKYPELKEGESFVTINPPEQNKNTSYLDVEFNIPVTKNDSAYATIYEYTKQQKDDGNTENIQGNSVVEITNEDIIVDQENPAKVRFMFDSSALANRTYMIVIPAGAFSAVGKPGRINQSWEVTYDELADSEKYPEYPAIPTLDIPSGLVSKDQLKDGKLTVTLSTKSQDACLMYTIDGSIPSKDSDTTEITGGETAFATYFDIDKTTTINAIACRPDGSQSAMLSETYYFEWVEPSESEITLHIPGNYSIIWASDRTYKSSNTAVATVTDAGMITAVSPGEAVITITSEHGATAEVKVTVTSDKTQVDQRLEDYYGDEVGEAVSNIINDYDEGKTLETIDSEVGDKVWMANLFAQTYTGAALKPTVRVYDGLKLLTQGKDYTVSYSNNTQVTSSDKPAKVVVKFKGNYASTKPITSEFFILEAALGTDIGVMESNVKATTRVKAFTPTMYWAETGKGLKFNKKYFKLTIKDPEGNEVTGTSKAGTYTATIEALEGSPFSKSTEFKIFVGSEKSMSDLKVVLHRKSFVYTGLPVTLKQDVYDYNNKIIAQKDFSILDKNGTPLKYDAGDYSVIYYNNTEPGKAALLITGTGAWQGDKLVNFTIQKGKPINADQVKVNISSAAYSAAGAKPEISLFDNQRQAKLKEGTDYTVTYKYNSKNPVGEKAGTAVIKGKGKYKSSRTVYFDIEKAALSAAGLTINVSDKILSKLPEGFKDSETIDDALKNPKLVVKAGSKALKAGRDYEIVSDSYAKESGENLITFNIRGLNSYAVEGDPGITVSYRVVSKDKNISSAKIGAISPKFYTGNAITLTDEEFKELVKLAGTPLVKDENYTVTYSSNTSVGKATVTLTGCGEYGGTKTFTFKIVSKNGGNARAKETT